MRRGSLPPSRELEDFLDPHGADIEQDEASTQHYQQHQHHQQHYHDQAPSQPNPFPRRQQLQPAHLTQQHHLQRVPPASACTFAASVPHSALQPQPPPLAHEMPASPTSLQVHQPQGHGHSSSWHTSAGYCLPSSSTFASAASTGHGLLSPFAGTAGTASAPYFSPAHPTQGQGPTPNAQVSPPQHGDTDFALGPRAGTRQAANPSQRPRVPFPPSSSASSSTYSSSSVFATKTHTLQQNPQPNPQPPVQPEANLQTLLQLLVQASSSMQQQQRHQQHGHSPALGEQQGASRVTPIPLQRPATSSHHHDVSAQHRAEHPLQVGGLSRDSLATAVSLLSDIPVAQAHQQQQHQGHQQPYQEQQPNTPPQHLHQERQQQQQQQQHRLAVHEGLISGVNQPPQLPQQQQQQQQQQQLPLQPLVHQFLTPASAQSQAAPRDPARAPQLSSTHAHSPALLQEQQQQQQHTLQHQGWQAQPSVGAAWLSAFGASQLSLNDGAQDEQRQARRKHQGRIKSKRYRMRKKALLSDLDREGRQLHVQCQQALALISAQGVSLASLLQEFPAELGRKQFTPPYVRRSYTEERFQQDCQHEGLAFASEEDMRREKSKRTSRFYRDEKRREEQAWVVFVERLRACHERLEQTCDALNLPMPQCARRHLSSSSSLSQL